MEDTIILSHCASLDKFSDLSRSTSDFYPVTPTRKVYFSSDWVPDSYSSKCMRCNIGFSLMTLRHHCRVCGYLVCSDCSPYKVRVKGFDKKQRACVYCTRYEIGIKKTKMKVYFDAGDIKILNIIGRGAQGELSVVSLRSKPDKIYACKIVDYSFSSQMEHWIFEQIDCPFLPTLYYTFFINGYQCFLMDYYSCGDLYNYLSSNKKMPVNQLKQIARDLVIGLDYLHNINVTYYDLKPENIMLTCDFHAVIIDFGSSLRDTTLFRGGKGISGSLEFTAPEVFQNEFHGQMVDFWSLGLVLAELLTGSLPFFSTNNDELIYNIITSEFECPAKSDKDATDFISKLLKKDPHDRLGSNGIEEIKSHPFFSGISWKWPSKLLKSEDERNDIKSIPKLDNQTLISSASYKILYPNTLFDYLLKNYNLEGFCYEKLYDYDDQNRIPCTCQ